MFNLENIHDISVEKKYWEVNKSIGIFSWFYLRSPYIPNYFWRSRQKKKFEAISLFLLFFSFVYFLLFFLSVIYSFFSWSYLHLLSFLLIYFFFISLKLIIFNRMSDEFKFFLNFYFPNILRNFPFSLFNFKIQVFFLFVTFYSFFFLYFFNLLFSKFFSEKMIFSLSILSYFVSGFFFNSYNLFFFLAERIIYFFFFIKFLFLDNSSKSSVKLDEIKNKRRKIKECLFCRITRREVNSYILYESELIIVIPDISPISNGHVLLITKEHFDNINDIDVNNWSSLKKAIEFTINTLKKKFGCSNFNIISNMGRIAFQSVFHFHLHIIPKFDKDYGFLWKINIDKSNIKDPSNIHSFFLIDKK